MDNQPKCFVPDCNNDVGVLFPKNPIVKKKWLMALGLVHLNSKIDCNSFVCLDHFEEDGQPGSLPKLSTSATLSTDVPESSKGVPGDTTLEKINHPRTRRSSHQAGLLQKIDSVIESEALKRQVMLKMCSPTKRSNASSIKQEEDKQLSRRKEVQNNHDGMCRLCMSSGAEAKESVFNKIDGKYTVSHMISVCLKPLQISSSDKLSKFVCLKCLRSLKEYFKFHQFCLGMDAKQRELIAIEQEYSSDVHYADSDISEEYLHEERLSDYEENKENKDDLRSEKTNGLIKKYSSEQENKTKDKISKKSDIDIKFDKVEEELAKVLEGKESADFNDSEDISHLEESNFYQPKVPDQSVINKNQHKSAPDHTKSISVQVKGKDDEIYTENIIIEMINDDEQEKPTPSIKLPITIKRINSDTAKKKPPKRRRSNSNPFYNPDENVTMIKNINNEEYVVLPKGIKVQVKEKYCSPLGEFSCESIKYLFNTEFLLAGGYLYEYWLAKDNIRDLHCVVARCPGVATQLRMGYNIFSNEVKVVKGHDHEPPDSLERKREMFYNIMYCKMRKDRNFNFKLLYEQFCKMDPDLTDILPLRKVISEICKQGPILQLPVMNSFNQFYDSIENDAFHKIHFTENNVQFYQDKFETEDGAKAVIFANPQIIELYSYSKLMYVDASFHIESSDFPYKLVTVLVWVYESYYPILFAFVNKKSQEIYKRIFSFLYNALGPKLRPEEIITDYEANLYYALGETYINSSIGGSMFYFAQNLYKKICALELSKELDLNSNFRNIYNLLLMLPLLPVNTILDGLNNIEVQAKELGLEDLTNDLFIHIHNEWICNVTPDFFCVHRLENRINENIVAPFKKLRDLIMLSRNKTSKTLSIASIVHIIEKILELEKFIRDTYNGPGKKTFAKDLSSSQKKIVLKAWNYIENHPKININHFFLKVLGYIKCLENQLWIWGFYRYEGDTYDELINANNFSIVNELDELEHQEHAPTEDVMDEEHLEGPEEEEEDDLDEGDHVIEEFYVEDGGNIRRVGRNPNATLFEEFSDEQQKAQTQETQTNSEKQQPAMLMEAVMDENGGFVLQNKTNPTIAASIDSNLV